jgi:tetratricopeptide (TPR) repeat protein
LDSAADDYRPNVLAELRSRQRDFIGRYEALLAKHPGHVPGLIAYGDLLLATGDESGSLAQWEKAAELSPRNAELWMELADRCTHLGNVKKSFVAYEHALGLKPRDLGLHRNYSAALFVYRKDAMEHYRITEAEVFERSLNLLKQALKHYPQNIDLAADLANSYYSVKPARNAEAVAAWGYVHNLAISDSDRQLARLHMARFLIRDGHREQALTMLAQVTLPEHELQKSRVAGSLAAPGAPGAVPASFNAE